MAAENTIEFIMKKGTGKKALFTYFRSWKTDVIAKILKESNVGSRYVVYFKIESREYNGRWYTTLVCSELMDWAVGADAALREAKRKAIQENIAKKSQESSMNKDLGLFNGVSEFE